MSYTTLHSFITTATVLPRLASIAVAMGFLVRRIKENRRMDNSLCTSTLKFGLKALTAPSESL